MWSQHQTSPVPPQDSDEDTGGWTRNVLQRTPVDSDSMPIVPKHPFSAEEGPVEFFRPRRVSVDDSADCDGSFWGEEHVLDCRLV